MLPIIKVLQNPVNESLSTIVNLLPLKGVWCFPRSSALIHSLRASKLLLISAPSIFVCLFWSKVSAPLSHPAKSINANFPWVLLPALSSICKMACDLEESALVLFWLVILTAEPWATVAMNSPVWATFFIVRPTMFTFCLASSLACSCYLPFRRSNNFPQYIS